MKQEDSININLSNLERIQEEQLQVLQNINNGVSLEKTYKQSSVTNPFKSSNFATPQNNNPFYMSTGTYGKGINFSAAQQNPFNNVGYAAKNFVASVGDVNATRGPMGFMNVMAPGTQTSLASRQLGIMDYSSNLFKGGIGAAGAGAGMLASKVGSAAGSTLLGGGVLGLAGGLAGGLLGGVAVGLYTDKITDEIDKQNTLAKYLYQNSTRFINSRESTNNKGIAGFSREQSYEAADFVRTINDEFFIDDEQMMNLLSKYTEGGLMKDVSDLETFQDKIKSLTESVKQGALILNDTYDNIAETMAELKQIGINTDKFDAIAGYQAASSGLTGGNASEDLQTNLEQAAALNRGTATSNDKTVRMLQDVKTYFGSMYNELETANENGTITDQQKLYFNSIANIGGSDQAGFQAVSSIYDFLENGKLSADTVGVLFNDYNESTGSWEFNRDSFERYLNSNYDYDELAQMAERKLVGLDEKYKNQGVKADWIKSGAQYMKNSMSGMDLLDYVDMLSNATIGKDKDGTLANMSKNQIFEMMGFDSSSSYLMEAVTSARNNAPDLLKEVSRNASWGMDVSELIANAPTMSERWSSWWEGVGDSVTNWATDANKWFGNKMQEISDEMAGISRSDIPERYSNMPSLVSGEDVTPDSMREARENISSGMYEAYNNLEQMGFQDESLKGIIESLYNDDVRSVGKNYETIADWSKVGKDLQDDRELIQGVADKYDLSEVIVAALQSYKQSNPENTMSLNDLASKAASLYNSDKTINNQTIIQQTIGQGAGTESAYETEKANRDNVQEITKTETNVAPVKNNDLYDKLYKFNQDSINDSYSKYIDSFRTEYKDLMDQFTKESGSPIGTSFNTSNYFSNYVLKDGTLSGKDINSGDEISLESIYKSIYNLTGSDKTAKAELFNAATILNVALNKNEEMLQEGSYLSENDFNKIISDSAQYKELTKKVGANKTESLFGDFYDKMVIASQNKLNSEDLENYTLESFNKNVLGKTEDDFDSYEEYVSYTAAEQKAFLKKEKNALLGMYYTDSESFNKNVLGVTKDDFDSYEEYEAYVAKEGIGADDLKDASVTEKWQHYQAYMNLQAAYDKSMGRETYANTTTSQQAANFFGVFLKDGSYQAGYITAEEEEELRHLTRDPISGKVYYDEDVYVSDSDLTKDGQSFGEGALDLLNMAVEWEENGRPTESVSSAIKKLTDAQEIDLSEDDISKMTVDEVNKYIEDKEKEVKNKGRSGRNLYNELMNNATYEVDENGNTSNWQVANNEFLESLDQSFRDYIMQNINQGKNWYDGLGEKTVQMLRLAGSNLEGFSEIEQMSGLNYTDETLSSLDVIRQGISSYGDLSKDTGIMGLLLGGLSNGVDTVSGVLGEELSSNFQSVVGDSIEALLSDSSIGGMTVKTDDGEKTLEQIYEEAGGTAEGIQEMLALMESGGMPVVVNGDFIDVLTEGYKQALQETMSDNTSLQDFLGSSTFQQWMEEGFGEREVTYSGDMDEDGVVSEGEAITQNVSDAMDHLAEINEQLKTATGNQKDNLEKEQQALIDAMSDIILQQQTSAGQISTASSTLSQLTDDASDAVDKAKTVSENFKKAFDSYSEAIVEVIENMG